MYFLIIIALQFHTIFAIFISHFAICSLCKKFLNIFRNFFGISSLIRQDFNIFFRLAVPLLQKFPCTFFILRIDINVTSPDHRSIHAAGVYFRINGMCL